MHIKIDYCHARKPVMIQRVRGGHRNAVDDAKSHRARALGVMPRRTHGAKGVFGFAGHHLVGGEHARARRAQGGIQRVRVHGRVGIEMHDAKARRRGLNGIEITRLVHALQLLARGFGRFALLHVVDEPRGNQLIVNRRQPRRAFGVMRAHVVQQAIAVGNESGSHAETP